MIATNTTISREGLRTRNVNAIGPGGLSGRPVFARSTEVISCIYRCSAGHMPIVGVGGIFDAQDAFAKITAGASLVQAYTGFVFGGPGFARDINTRLLRLLEDGGFSTLDDAVGNRAG